MRREASAYAALGLEPGADRADVERAYRRLIKLHHPDRSGGDASRAAEINRAYRELRARNGPVVLHHDDESIDEGTGKEWVRLAIALAIAVAVLLVLTGPVTAYFRQLVPLSDARLAAGRSAPGARASDAMAQPIDRSAVDEAIREAVGMIGSRDDTVLLNASRDCHRQLRLRPSVAQLDRCAAFDDAVNELQNRDPMWDRGPFSQIAVTGRQWSAAAALSNDYLAIDGRLHRLRVQVELALASREPTQKAD